jgi:hypothetical protein
MSSPKPRPSRGLHDFVSRRSGHARPFHTRGDRSRTESPSPSDGYSDISGVEVKQEVMVTAGIFEASSLGDSDSTISRRQQLEQHKLPVPLVGAAARREDNDDELVVLDRKPQIFDEEERFSDEEEFDETAEVPGGYDDNSDNDYGYTGEHDGYEESEKSEDDENATQRVAPPEPGLWDDTQQTLSSRGLFDHSTVGKETFVEDTPPQQQQQQRTHAVPLRGNRFSPPQPKEPSTFRPLATARSTTFVAASSTAFGNVNPSASSSSAFANPPVLYPPPLQQQQRPLPPTQHQHQQRHQQHQQHLPLPPTQQQQHSLPPPQQQRSLPPHDPDQTIRLSRPTSPTANTPLANTPLLADSDLRSIPSYAALLSRLQDLYLSSRSAAPPNLSTELFTLLSYSYPSKEVSKVSKFITALPDDAYEAAGDIIVARKRELEDRLREMQRKRRKLVEARTEEVREVAEERVRRLEMLRKKREELRGGVGKLLRENGWAVEL